MPSVLKFFTDVTDAACRLRKEEGDNASKVRSEMHNVTEYFI